MRTQNTKYIITENTIEEFTIYSFTIYNLTLTNTTIFYNLFIVISFSTWQKTISLLTVKIKYIKAKLHHKSHKRITKVKFVFHQYLY